MSYNLLGLFAFVDDLQRFLEETKALPHLLVETEMLREAIGSFEGFTALLASIPFLFLVFHHYMLGQIGRLVEPRMAAWNGTDEGALTRVNTQVVKEVSPLPERPTAVLEVTLHNPDLAHRCGVPELEYAEVLCLWDGLVNFMNFVTEILIIAMQNVDL